MMEQDVKTVLARARRCSIDHLPDTLKHELGLLTLTHDASLAELLSLRLDDIEGQYLDQGFLEPDPEARLNVGDVHILTTPGGQDICVSFHKKDGITHVLVTGATGMGKSVFTSVFASGIAPRIHSLVLDVHGDFRRLGNMRDYVFVPWSELILNIFDVPAGVNPEQVDNIMVHELAKSYNLEFAEFLMRQLVTELRAQGDVNLPSLLCSLEAQRFTTFNMARYRDSACLVLRKLLAATQNLFCCSHGMSIEGLLEGNVVFDLRGMLTQEQAFLARVIIEHVHLLAMTGRKKQLVVFIDEAEELLKQPGFPAKMLGLRHAGISLVLNVQNASVVPVEVSGNADCFIAFQLTDARDRFMFGNLTGLSREQADRLAALERGTCVYYLPRSRFKAPGLGRVPQVDMTPVENDVEGRTRGFLSRFSWVGVKESWNDMTEQKRDVDKEHFVRDVVNQAHEFSPLGARFERAGIRSAARQGQIIKKLIVEGMIRVYSLVVGRGHPVKLVEPTDKLLESCGVTWKKSRGLLPTRAATEFLWRKFQRCEGWSCIKEGMVGDKQVDLVVRDPANDVFTIEIANSVGHEVHNAIACLDVEEVRKHIVVCLTQKGKEEVKRMFKEHSELCASERIMVTTLSHVLKDEFELLGPSGEG